MRVKRTAQLFGWCVLAFALAGSAAPAAAQTLQTPNVEIGAGLQFLHVPGETYPFGWNLDLSGPIGDHEAMRWVGEGGMARDTPVSIGGTLTFYHLGGGVRFMAAERAHAAPYFQVIGGAAHGNNSATQVSQWAPMVQPGVGVSVPINHFVNVIGQGDYRFAIFNGQIDNEFRFSVGARFMLW
jgi:hypothetical protein